MWEKDPGFRSGSLHKSTPATTEHNPAEKSKHTSRADLRRVAHKQEHEDGNLLVNQQQPESAGLRPVADETNWTREG
jgi:hypothetical protein